MALDATTTAAVTSAKTFLSNVSAKYNAAYTSAVSSVPTWTKGAGGWQGDANSYSVGGPVTAGQLQQDLASAVQAGNALATSIETVTDPTTGMASLDIAAQSQTVSALIDQLATAAAASGGLQMETNPLGGNAGSTALTITPTPPGAGVNAAADAQAQLSALQTALAGGDIASAQVALNALAGDVQAIAAGGSVPASGGAPAGTVTTGSAVGIGVGSLAVGGVVGGLIGHAIASGVLFAGESREGAAESKRKKTSKRKR